MKIEELRELIETKTTEVRGFVSENKSEEAKKSMEELRGLKENLKIAEELEEGEKRDLEQQKNNKEERGNVEMEKVNEMRSIVKSVLGKEMTQEERAVVKTVDNAAVLPKQYINRLEELKKGFGSLKSLCDVIPVTKNEGSMPVVDLEQNELKDVAEGDAITEGSLVTTDITFKCAKVGLLQPLSSELVEDAEIEIENIVEKNFAELVSRNENKRILTAIDTNATDVVDPVDYTALEDVMAKALPSVKNGLVTLVNVNAYALLKNMKDKQGRNMNLITVVGDTEYFNGKPIYTFDDTLITVDPLKTKVFYSLSIKEAIKFFDRKAPTVARASKFENDTNMVRILERLDVKKGTARSIKKIELA